MEQEKKANITTRPSLGPTVVKGGEGGVTQENIGTSENFEAKAVRLYSFSATPGKQCLPPKVSLGGLRDRTVEYTT